MIAAVTTCHAEGWQQYGRRMAESWRQHWSVPLRVYGEGFTDGGTGHMAVDLNTAAPWLAKFKALHPYKHPGRPYNYRMDAARFAHKVAAVMAAAESPEIDFLIWVDADTVTHQDVPPGFVESLLPKADEYIAWLDRKNKYPECGFFILNCRHTKHGMFLRALRKAYVGGELFNLEEWHDSYVIEQIVKRLGLPTKSLSGKAGFNTSHPFVNGPLGAYMDHLKGSRKAAGKSLERDLKVERTEPYWSKK